MAARGRGDHPPAIIPGGKRPRQYMGSGAARFATCIQAGACVDPSYKTVAIYTAFFRAFFCRFCVDSQTVCEVLQ